MYDHIQECKGNGGGNPLGPESFRMDVVSKDEDSLRRILREAVRIKDVLEGEEVEVKTMEEGVEREIKAKLAILNSKREFHLPTLGASRVRGVVDNL